MPLKRRVLDIVRTLAGVSFFILIFHLSAHAQVAVVLSKDIGMYREAADKVMESLPNSGGRLYLFPSSDKGEIQSVLEQVRSFGPKIIVAVGSKAASECRKAFPGKPLVYLMVVYPER